MYKLADLKRITDILVHNIIIIMRYLYTPLELPTEIVSISDQGVAS